MKIKVIKDVISFNVKVCYKIKNNYTYKKEEEAFIVFFLNTNFWEKKKSQNLQLWIIALYILFKLEFLNALKKLILKFYLK